jgi:hypothetical protein
MAFAPFAVAAATASTATILISAATTTVAAAAAAEGGRGIVSTKHGKANDREENRNSKHNNSVHSQILQKDLLVPYAKTLMPSDFGPRCVTAGRARNDQSTLRAFAPSTPTKSLLRIFVGCEGYSENTG